MSGDVQLGAFCSPFSGILRVIEISRPVARSQFPHSPTVYFLGTAASTRDRLSECDPEPVHISDDELSHSVEGVVQVLDNFDLALQSPAKRFNVIHLNIKIHLAALRITWFSAAIEHHFTVAKCQQRPVDFAIFLVVTDDLESNR